MIYQTRIAYIEITDAMWSELLGHFIYTKRKPFVQKEILLKLFARYVAICWSMFCPADGVKNLVRYHKKENNSSSKIDVVKKGDNKKVMKTI